MMFNRHKNHNRSFFWGMVAGLVGGIWVSNKWMHKDNQHHEQNSAQSLTNQSHKTSQHQQNFKFHHLNDLENKQKEALFDAFLHGSKEELESKAKEFQS
ncbi:hypothetical protein [Tepidibacillus fermentans]|uniref:Uncharacterized protein n=1 Tax=Tepidibacillus fermentans TaxID=1281767 RepID=A0A4R3KK77_9BACI|nr:hypothetical protein [Tepidibacillus fermentans]TCS84114.1 hypothetical protein EDD72_102157 [Tepidibacillus fermentans]